MHVTRAMPRRYRRAPKLHDASTQQLQTVAAETDGLTTRARQALWSESPREGKTIRAGNSSDKGQQDYTATVQAIRLKLLPSSLKGCQSNALDRTGDWFDTLVRSQLTLGQGHLVGDCIHGDVSETTLQVWSLGERPKPES